LQKKYRFRAAILSFKSYFVLLSIKLSIKKIVQNFTSLPMNYSSEDKIKESSIIQSL
jgi:hypothetical protein